MFGHLALHRSAISTRLCAGRIFTGASGSAYSRKYGVNADLGSKYTERVRQIADEKGLSVEQLKEQAKLAREEKNRRLREEHEAALATQKKRQGTSSEAPTSTSLYAKSRNDSVPVKPLSSILNISRILSAPHTPNQIAQLWNAYHMSRSGGTGRGFLSASIPIELYQKMSALAEQYPTFIVPIRRRRDTSTPLADGESDTAYEFFLLQWEFFDAPTVPSVNGDLFKKHPSSESPKPKISVVLFTPLEEYKIRDTYATPYLALTNYTDLALTHGQVLLRGEITPRTGASGNYMLSQDDAQQLSMAMQKFYLWENGEKLLRTFHEKPEEFRWEDLLQVTDLAI